MEWFQYTSMVCSSSDDLLVERKKEAPIVGRALLHRHAAVGRQRQRQQVRHDAAQAQQARRHRRRHDHVVHLLARGGTTNQ